MRGEHSRARLRMIVGGRVQGVFFRAAAAEQARALGLVGYARNRDDGTVEIVAEGDRHALEILEAWADRRRRELKMCKLNGANRPMNAISSAFAEVPTRPFHLERS